MNYLLCVDIFSGLGGFSEAFIDRGWDVIRIDNDEKFKDVPNTIIGNVGKLPLKRKLRPDILLMAPPCKRFSVASIWRYWGKGGKPKPEVVQDMRLVFWGLDAVDYLKPKYWVLENPRGMMRRVLGYPEVTTFFASWGSPLYKPTDLWGDIPSNMEWPKPKNWEKAPRGSHKGIAKSMQTEERSKIPYNLSEALAIAVEKARE